MFSKFDVFCVCDFESTGVDNIDYPIEVGCIFTDSNFILKDTVDELIRWDKLYEECVWDVDGEDIVWPIKYTDGYKFAHKIDAQYWSDKSIDKNIVAEKIYNICKKLGSSDHRKPIIVSDNGMFEYNFMKKLFDNSDFEFPFHYSSWDVNFFIEGSSLFDEYKPIHRAFSDACDQYHMVMRVMQHYNFFNKKLFYER